MFIDARSLDRQRTTESFEKALDRYAAASERWFDGTINSVDQRLQHCDRLLHSARVTVARLSIGDSQRFLRVAENLDADRRVLVTMRDDLLTGASNREDVSGPPGWRTAKAKVDFDQPKDLAADEAGRTYDTHKYIKQRYPDIFNEDPDYTGEDFGENYARPRMRPRISSADTRWVALESAKFVAANNDALNDSVELATRASHHAAVKTSTFPAQRSAAICEAFVEKVVDLGRQTYRPAPVRTAAIDVEFDAQAIYLC